MMHAPRTALVTGATSGIGRAIAMRLARDGFHIVAGGRDPGRGAATVEAIERVGGSAEFHGFDLTDEAEWAALTAKIVSDHGQLDAVVNSTGHPFSKAFPDTTLEAFRALWIRNVESVLLGTKYAFRAMRDTRSAGSIVNISSLAGLVGIQDSAGYCAAMAAVTHFCRVAALEGALFDPKIRVNSLNPGLADSDAEGLANAAAYLVGSASRMVTGTAMAVDGGRGVW